VTVTPTEAGHPPRARAAVVRDALGVGVTVGLSGFAFGVTSAGSGLSVAQTCALSLLVFTGASQFALVGALGAGGNPMAAAAGALFLGVRNAFYGLRLSQLLGLPTAVRPLAAQWVIDETSAVALAQPDRARARLGFTATGLSLYLGWNLTTLLGALGASTLGDPSVWGLDAAGPAVFLALLVPMLRGGNPSGPRSDGPSGRRDGLPGARAAHAWLRGSWQRARQRQEILVAAVSVVLTLACLPYVPAGVPILVAALAAPAVLGVTRTHRTDTRSINAGLQSGGTGTQSTGGQGGPA
jgi:predicted branched-subunit amino acid permease